MSRTNFSAEEIASWPEDSKRCLVCMQVKPLGDFHKMKQGLFGVNTKCKECRQSDSASYYLTQSFAITMLNRARSRAKEKGREFSIELDDIVIPELCPVLGVPIVKERHSPYAPSLDRIDSNGGYTKDNVIVMSKRANMLKNNATLDEVKLLLSWLESNRS